MAVIETERDEADASEREFHDAYELGPRIGSGGTSEVHEAVQRRLERRVAIKFLTPRTPDDLGWRERFMREAHVCAGLSHRNVLLVYDHGVRAGTPYLVTELVEGQSLAAAMLDPVPLTAGAVFTIVEQILDGLEAVHALGVVHRDLKPENVLITSGPDLVVKISDFGLAKRAGGSGPVTAQGVVLGTPAYMAPEQVAGQLPSPASDLYAVAVMLYELVVGEHPFPRAATTREMLQAQLFTEPRVPWTLHPGLRRVLERGLAKSPEHRYQSAVQLRRALREVESDILGAAGIVSRVSMPTPRPRAPLPPASRLPRIAAAFGVACALLVAVLLPALLWSRP